MDAKEKRLKELQSRFRSIGRRQDFIAGLRRRSRDPKFLVMGFLVLAALFALFVAVF
ncbi:MAG TPA: hypothetical protein VEF76_02980 [Patescibacteria group bacterium]|nr:hypothetical protein [Patescibacteria group bacterium]